MKKPQLAVASAAGAQSDRPHCASLKPGKPDRQRPRPHLAEPKIIAEWWRDRSGHSIRVALQTYNGHNLLDIRTWYTVQGKLVPGRGFSANVRHLPRLAKELTKAIRHAVELGLLDPDEAGQ
jgi:Transcriptional Coactivator p15 (PC4)